MEILAFIFAVIAAAGLAISSVYQFIQGNIATGFLSGIASVYVFYTAIKQLD